MGVKRVQCMKKYLAAEFKNPLYCRANISNPESVSEDGIYIN